MTNNNFRVHFSENSKKNINEVFDTWGNKWVFRTILSVTFFLTPLHLPIPIASITLVFFAILFPYIILLIYSSDKQIRVFWLYNVFCNFIFFTIIVHNLNSNIAMIIAMVLLMPVILFICLKFWTFTDKKDKGLISAFLIPLFIIVSNPDRPTDVKIILYIIIVLLFLLALGIVVSSEKEREYAREWRYVLYKEPLEVIANIVNSLIELFKNTFQTLYEFFANTLLFLIIPTMILTLAHVFLTPFDRFYSDYYVLNLYGNFLPLIIQITIYFLLLRLFGSIVIDSDLENVNIAHASNFYFIFLITFILVSIAWATEMLTNQQYIIYDLNDPLSISSLIFIVIGITNAVLPQMRNLLGLTKSRKFDLIGEDKGVLTKLLYSIALFVAIPFFLLWPHTEIPSFATTNYNVSFVTFRDINAEATATTESIAATATIDARETETAYTATSMQMTQAVYISNRQTLTAEHLPSSTPIATDTPMPTTTATPEPTTKAVTPTVTIAIAQMSSTEPIYFGDIGMFQQVLTPGTKHIWLYRGNVGETLIITVTADSNSWDTTLAIRFNAEILAFNDDYVGLNSQIFFEVPEDGVYEIEVGGLGYDGGQYTLEIQPY